METDDPTRRQIRLRDLFIATFWAAAFSLGVVLLDRLGRHELTESEGPAYLVIGCFLFMSLGAAIGALCGRALWGATVGFILYALYAGWILLALNTWRGT